jgi:hypothetical protein
MKLCFVYSASWLRKVAAVVAATAIFIELLWARKATDRDIEKS